MQQFKEFKEKHGPAKLCRSVSKEQITAYKEKLPQELISEWEHFGWCSYSDGLLWLTNPDEMKVVIADWLGTSSKAIVFAKSAFGHLFLWDKDCAYNLDPKYGRLTKIVSNINLVFDYVFCQKEYLEKVLYQKLFRKALKKLGLLQFDECYGFEPALALGGPGTLDTLRKVKLREHLSILVQLVDELRSV